MLDLLYLCSNMKGKDVVFGNMDGVLQNPGTTRTDFGDFINTSQPKWDGNSI